MMFLYTNSLSFFLFLFFLFFFSSFILVKLWIFIMFSSINDKYIIKIPWLINTNYHRFVSALNFKFKLRSFSNILCKKKYNHHLITSILIMQITSILIHNLMEKKDRVEKKNSNAITWIFYVYTFLYLIYVQEKEIFSFSSNLHKFHFFFHRFLKRKKNPSWY